MRVHNAVPTIICALVVIGCGDSTGPAASANLEHVSMTFCDDAPTWIAHQDEGGKWTRVNVINGEASFDGTEKQALAIASNEYGARIQVIYATATALNTLGCDEELPYGPKNITGSVAGLGTYGASIALGTTMGYAMKDYPSFSLYGVKDGALDLVATRSAGYSGPPDRMIMRRAQNLAHNATLSLDFGAAEAFALATHNVTVTGTGSLVVLDQELRTANGTRLHLQSLAAGKPAVNLPANQAVAGDLYETSATTLSTVGIRGVALFYHDATDRTLAFGPDVPTPTIVSVAGAPYRRLRAEFTAPAEYAGGASMAWFQYQGNTYRGFTITILKDYLGAMPAKWSFEMPDFTGVEGFQASWALGSGEYDWSVQLVHGTTEAITEGIAKDGDVLRFAARSSEPLDSPQAGAASMRRAPSWPRLFSMKK